MRSTLALEDRHRDSGSVRGTSRLLLLDVTDFNLDDVAMPPQPRFGSAQILMSMDASSAPYKAHTELRVFFIDKATDKSLVDLKGFTVTAEIRLRDGELRKLPMVLVEPKLERKAEPKTEPKIEPRKAQESHVCGQVKELDKWWVELTVVQPLHADKPADVLRQGYLHDHGGPYFELELPADMIRAGTLCIDIDLSVTVGGDTQKVKNYNYPQGLYEDTVGWIRKTLKDVGKSIDKGEWDKAAAPLPHMCSMIQSLPALSIEKAKVDADAIRKECLDAMCDLETAVKSQVKDSGKKSIERCDEKLDALKAAAIKCPGARMN